MFALKRVVPNLRVAACAVRFQSTDAAAPEAAAAPAADQPNKEDLPPQVQLSGRSIGFDVNVISLDPSIETHKRAATGHPGIPEIPPVSALRTNENLFVIGRRKFGEEISKVRAEYVKETQAKKLVEQQKKLEEYAAIQLRKARRLRHHAVRVQIRQSIHAKRLEQTSQESETRKEVRVENRLKYENKLTTQRRFQINYLLQEASTSWVRQPEDIQESLFESITAEPAGWWPEKPAAEEQSQTQQQQQQQQQPAQ